MRDTMSYGLYMKNALVKSQRKRNITAIKLRVRLLKCDRSVSRSSRLITEYRDSRNAFARIVLNATLKIDIFAI